MACAALISVSFILSILSRRFPRRSSRCHEVTGAAIREPAARQAPGRPSRRSAPVLAGALRSGARRQLVEEADHGLEAPAGEDADIRALDHRRALGRRQLPGEAEAVVMLLHLAGAPEAMVREAR